MHQFGWAAERDSQLLCGMYLGSVHQVVHYEKMLEALFSYLFMRMYTSYVTPSFCQLVGWTSMDHPRPMKGIINVFYEVRATGNFRIIHSKIQSPLLFLQGGVNKFDLGIWLR